ncbi:PfkB family carbohydrate kinase [Mangrovicoccus algicola]|uniref:Kinase n=1 Tax=Mangrovicoccus algicola TaxID=2771008 RepID=A0A8J6YT72_9RHOB|nr:PfkB family carbohydrate kinase [Mangrovicoccus algicola]MBE3637180.1 kinase [Mangrovicoccus algicola]
MTPNRHILCIGSALWDTIGRHEQVMEAGQDRPGRIRRVPGGVALNIAMALARLGMAPQVLTVLGTDAEGDTLAAACARRGVDLALALRRADLPTDAYMAVEGANGLIAAIADAHSLEAAGDAILAPLEDGRLGSPAFPYGGTIALDGNLTAALLGVIAASPLFAAADLRIAPASPGKADRLTAFLAGGRGTLYVNREEANLLSGCNAPDAGGAARALLKAGAERCIVTDGIGEAVDLSATNCYRATPPLVEPRRVTGAGDTLMAVHIAAELQGMGRGEALAHATQSAARYVAGEDIS